MAFSLSQMHVALREEEVLFFPALERWLETERERLALWVPVFLGIGILAWFGISTPSGWAAWVGLCALIALAGLALPHGGRVQRCVVIAACLMAAGCVLIWGKALLMGETPLARPVFTQVEGQVVAVEQQAARAQTRVTVAPIARPDLPSRIRVNIVDEDMPPGIGKGARIAFRSRLMPPPAPDIPGAYDFARSAYFKGLGATGRALPPIAVKEPASNGAADLRGRLAQHILSRLGDGGEGALAVTLATGDRGSLSDADEEAMRRSGLAHLLSISGLHVSALIGGVILLVYRLLALSPRLALSLPLMVIAAACGAAAGIFYTLLTGADVPTVRSCIAALLVLGGMALGREAISLRLIAVGALVVLIFWPEALVGPSFQMSFLAVTIIVALAEAGWFRSLTLARDEAWPMKAARNLLGLFVVGVAIEIALMPIAIYHFHEAGMLGAFANLVAIPLTTFVVMPVEALALALDVVGLGAPFWWVTGKALQLLLALAHMVGGHPWAVWALPFHSSAAYLLAAAGALWLILWTTRVRLAGVPLIVVGLIMMLMSPRPDLLVTGDGRHMAMRQPDGSLMLLRDRAGDYVRDMMSAAAGLGRSSAADDGVPHTGITPGIAEARNARCSLDMCTIRMTRPERDWIIVATRSQVRLPWRALIDVCTRADIVISDRRLPSACAPRWLKLDRAHLRETGGVAIYLDPHEWVGVRDPDDRHPWISR